MVALVIAPSASATARPSSLAAGSTRQAGGRAPHMLAPPQHGFLQGAPVKIATTPPRPMSRQATTTAGNFGGRLARVARSQWGVWISAREDPEKMIDQVVTEMQTDIVKLRQACAQVMASRKQLERRYLQAKQVADEWEGRAELAVQRGADDLARQALQRMRPARNDADNLGRQLEQQTEVLEKLKANSAMLETKVGEARQKKQMLKARAQSAKAGQWVNDVISGLNTGSALAAFERMEEKVDAMEAEAEAASEMALMGANDSLVQQFALMDGTVEDDLLRLKSDLAIGKPELPAGRPIGEAIEEAIQTQVGEVLMEVEDDLARLRQRVVAQKKITGF